MIDAATHVSLTSKITLQEACREQRWHRGAHGAIKGVQEAVVLASKGVSDCQEPASPHPGATKRTEVQKLTLRCGL